MFYENRSSVICTLARLQKINVAMYPSLIDRIVDCIVDAVQFSVGCSPSIHRPSQLMEYSLFKGFVSRVLRLSHIPMDIILVALAYVDKMKLSRILEYGPGTHERVFIGALLLATKFISNDSFATRRFESAQMLFDKDEVYAIETCFLLDFGVGDVTITEEDIIAHHRVFLEDTLSPPTQCYRAHCQVHDHSLSLVSKFCPPHKESHIPATKFPRQTRWRKLWDESCLARIGLVH